MATSSSDLPPTSNQQIFSDFFDCWIGQMERDLRPLYAMVGSASTSSSTSTQEPPTGQQQEDESQARLLVDRVIGHYEYYVQAKAALARGDVLPMFAPTWTSSTDNLFIWVGGYRPSTAFHVLYSKSGLQLDFHLARLSIGMSPAEDLADLSHSQMQRIDALHRDTIRREKQISEEEAVVQESVASPEMVAISHEVSETMMNSRGNGGLIETAMEGGMKQMREMMATVLEKADILRLDTLKGLVATLRPLQAVHFLIAAFELLLRVHQFGKRTDYAARLRATQRTKSAVF